MQKRNLKQRKEGRTEGRKEGRLNDVYGGGTEKTNDV